MADSLTKSTAVEENAAMQRRKRLLNAQLSIVDAGSSANINNANLPQDWRQIQMFNKNSGALQSPIAPDTGRGYVDPYGAMSSTQYNNNNNNSSRIPPQPQQQSSYYHPQQQHQQQQQFVVGPLPTHTSTTTSSRPGARNSLPNPFAASSSFSSSTSSSSRAVPRRPSLDFVDDDEVISAAAGRRRRTAGLFQMMQQQQGDGGRGHYGGRIAMQNDNNNNNSNNNRNTYYSNDVFLNTSIAEVNSSAVATFEEEGDYLNSNTDTKKQDQNKDDGTNIDAAAAAAADAAGVLLPLPASSNIVNTSVASSSSTTSSLRPTELFPSGGVEDGQAGEHSTHITEKNTTSLQYHLQQQQQHVAMSRGGKQASENKPLRRQGGASAIHSQQQQQQQQHRGDTSHTTQQQYRVPFRPLSSANNMSAITNSYTEPSTTTAGGGGQGGQQQQPSVRAELSILYAAWEQRLKDTEASLQVQIQTLTRKEKELQTIEADIVKRVRDIDTREVSIASREATCKVNEDSLRKRETACETRDAEVSRAIEVATERHRIAGEDMNARVAQAEASMQAKADEIDAIFRDKEAQLDLQFRGREVELETLYRRREVELETTMKAREMEVEDSLRVLNEGRIQLDAASAQAAGIISMRDAMTADAAAATELKSLLTAKLAEVESMERDLAMKAAQNAEELLLRVAMLDEKDVQLQQVRQELSHQEEQLQLEAERLRAIQASFDVQRHELDQQATTIAGEVQKSTELRHSALHSIFDAEEKQCNVQAQEASLTEREKAFQQSMVQAQTSFETQCQHRKQALEEEILEAQRSFDSQLRERQLTFEAEVKERHDSVTKTEAHVREAAQEFSRVSAQYDQDLRARIASIDASEAYRNHAIDTRESKLEIREKLVSSSIDVLRRAVRFLDSVNIASISDDVSKTVVDALRRAQSERRREAAAVAASATAPAASTSSSSTFLSPPEALAVVPIEAQPSTRDEIGAVLDGDIGPLSPLRVANKRNHMGSKKVRNHTAFSDSGTAGDAVSANSLTSAVNDQTDTFIFSRVALRASRHIDKAMSAAISAFHAPLASEDEEDQENIAAASSSSSSSSSAGKNTPNHQSNEARDTLHGDDDDDDNDAFLLAQTSKSADYLLATIRTSLQSMLHDVSAMKGSLAQRVQDLQSREGNLKTAQGAIKEKQQSLEGQTALLTAETEKLMQAKLALQAEEASLQRRIQVVADQESEIAAETHRVREILARETRLAEWAAELAQLNTSHEDREVNLVAQEKHLTLETAASEKRKLEAARILEEAQLTSTRLVADAERQVSNAELMSKRIAEREGQVQADRDSINSDLVRLKSRSEHIEQQQVEIDRERAAVNLLKQSLENDRIDMERQRARLGDDITDLSGRESEISKREAAATAKERALADAEQTMEDREAECRHNLTALAMRKKELEDQEHTVESATVRSRTTLASHEKQLDELVSQIDRARAQAVLVEGRERAVEEKEELLRARELVAIAAKQKADERNLALDVAEGKYQVQFDRLIAAEQALEMAKQEHQINIDAVTAAEGKLKSAEEQLRESAREAQARDQAIQAREVACEEVEESMQRRQALLTREEEKLGASLERLRHAEDALDTRIHEFEVREAEESSTTSAGARANVALAAKLEASNAVLEVKLKDVETHYADLKVREETLLKQMATFRDETEAAHVRLAEQTGRIQAMNDELGIAQEILKKRDAEVGHKEAAADAKFKGAQDEVERRTRAITDTEARLEDRKKDLLSLEKTFESRESALVTREAAAETREVSVRRREADAIAAQESADKTRADANDRLTDLESRAMKLTAKETMLNSREDAIRETSADLEARERKTIKFMEEATLMKAEASDLMVTVKAKEHAREAEHTSKMRELHAEKEALTNAQERLKSQLDATAKAEELLLTVRTQETGNRAEAQRLAIEKERHEADRDAVSMMRAALEKDREDMSRDTQKLRDMQLATAEAEGKAHRTVAEAQAIQTRIHEVEAREAEINLREKQLIERERKVTEDAATQRAATSALEVAVSTHQQAVTRFESEMQRMKDVIAADKAEVVGKQEALEAQKRKIAHETAEMKEARLDVDRRTAEIKKIETETIAMKQEAQTNLNELKFATAREGDAFLARERALKDARDSLASARVAHREEIDAITLSTRKKEIELNTLIEDLNAREESLMAAQKELIGAQERLEQRAEAVQRRVHELEGESQSLKAAQLLCEDERASITRSRQQVDDSLAIATQRLQAAAEAERVLQIKEDTMKGEIAKLDEMKDELANEKDMMNDSFRQSRSQLTKAETEALDAVARASTVEAAARTTASRLTAELDIRLRDLDARETALTKERQRIATDQFEMQEAKSELAVLASTMEAREESMNRREHGLRQAMQEAEKEREALQFQARELRERADALKQQVESFAAQEEDMRSTLASQAMLLSQQLQQVEDRERIVMSREAEIQMNAASTHELQEALEAEKKTLVTVHGVADAAMKQAQQAAQEMEQARLHTVALETEAQEKLNKISAEVTAINTKSASLARRENEVEAQAEAVEAAARRLEAELHSLQEARASLAQRDEGIEEKSRALELAAQSLDKRDATSRSKFETFVKTKESEISRREQVLVEREKEFRALRARLESQRSEADAVVLRMKEEGSKLHELRRAFAEQEAAVAAREAAVREADERAKLAQLDALNTSREYDARVHQSQIEAATAARNLQEEKQALEKAKMSLALAHADVSRMKDEASRARDEAMKEGEALKAARMKVEADRNVLFLDASRVATEELQHHYEGGSGGNRNSSSSSNFSVSTHHHQGAVGGGIFGTTTGTFGGLHASPISGLVGIGTQALQEGKYFTGISNNNNASSSGMMLEFASPVPSSSSSMLPTSPLFSRSMYNDHQAPNYDAALTPATVANGITSSSNKEETVLQVTSSSSSFAPAASVLVPSPITFDNGTTTKINAAVPTEISPSSPSLATLDRNTPANNSSSNSNNNKDKDSSNSPDSVDVALLLLAEAANAQTGERRASIASATSVSSSKNQKQQTKQPEQQQQKDVTSPQASSSTQSSSSSSSSSSASFSPLPPSASAALEQIAQERAALQLFKQQTKAQMSAIESALILAKTEAKQFQTDAAEARAKTTAAEEELQRQCEILSKKNEEVGRLFASLEALQASAAAASVTHTEAVANAAVIAAEAATAAAAVTTATKTPPPHQSSSSGWGGGSGKPLSATTTTTTTNPRTRSGSVTGSASSSVVQRRNSKSSTTSSNSTSNNTNTPHTPIVGATGSRRQSSSSTPPPAPPVSSQPLLSVTTDVASPSSSTTSSSASEAILASAAAASARLNDAVAKQLADILEREKALEASSSAISESRAKLDSERLTMTRTFEEEKRNLSSRLLLVETNLEASNRALKEKDDHAAHQADLVKMFESHAASLQQVLQECESSYHSALSQVNALTQDCEALRSTQSRLEEQFQECESNLTEAKQEIARLTAQSEAERVHTEASSKRKDELVSKTKSDCETRLRAMREELEIRVAAESEKELKIASELGIMTTENEDLREENMKLLRRISAAVEEKDMLQVQLNAQLKEAQKAVDAARSEAAQQIQNQQGGGSTAPSSSLSSFASSSSSSDLTPTQAQILVNVAVANINALNELALKKKDTDFEAKLAQLHSVHAHVVEIKETQIVDLQSQLMSLESEKSSLQSKLEDIQVSLQEKSALLQTAEAELGSLRTELAAASSTAVDLRTQLADAKRRLLHAASQPRNASAASSNRSSPTSMLLQSNTGGSGGGGNAGTSFVPISSAAAPPRWGSSRRGSTTSSVSTSSSGVSSQQLSATATSAGGVITSAPLLPTESTETVSPPPSSSNSVSSSGKQQQQQQVIKPVARSRSNSHNSDKSSGNSSVSVSSKPGWKATALVTTSTVVSSERRTPANFIDSSASTVSSPKTAPTATEPASSSTTTTLTNAPTVITPKITKGSSSSKQSTSSHVSAALSASLDAEAELAHDATTSTHDNNNDITPSSAELRELIATSKTRLGRLESVSVALNAAATNASGKVGGESKAKDEEMKRLGQAVTSAASAVISLRRQLEEIAGNMPFIEDQEAAMSSPGTHTSAPSARAAAAQYANELHAELARWSAECHTAMAASTSALQAAQLSEEGIVRREWQRRASDASGGDNDEVTASLRMAESFLRTSQARTQNVQIRNNLLSNSGSMGSPSIATSSSLSLPSSGPSSIIISSSADLRRQSTSSSTTNGNNTPRNGDLRVETPSIVSVPVLPATSIVARGEVVEGEDNTRQYNEESEETDAELLESILQLGRGMGNAANNTALNALELSSIPPHLDGDDDGDGNGGERARSDGTNDDNKWRGSSKSSTQADGSSSAILFASRSGVSSGVGSRIYNREEYDHSLMISPPSMIHRGNRNGEDDEDHDDQLAGSALLSSQVFFSGSSSGIGMIGGNTFVGAASSSSSNSSNNAHRSSSTTTTTTTRKGSAMTKDMQISQLKEEEEGEDHQVSDVNDDDDNEEEEVELDAVIASLPESGLLEYPDNDEGDDDDDEEEVTENSTSREEDPTGIKWLEGKRGEIASQIRFTEAQISRLGTMGDVAADRSAWKRRSALIVDLATLKDDLTVLDAEIRQRQKK